MRGLMRRFIILVLLSFAAFSFYTWSRLPPPAPSNGGLGSEWQWARHISLVFLWVNGSDPVYAAEKARVLHRPFGATTNDRSNDELRYALRSYEQYMPWHLGTVYLLTPAQMPSWLNVLHPRLKVINQADILPADSNPTFNSHLITWYLDRIPGLSEYFIIIEDDNFATNYTHPSVFFSASNETRFFDNAHFADPEARIENSTRAESDATNAAIDAGASINLFEAARQFTAAALKEVYADSQAHFILPKHAPMVLRRSYFPPARLIFARWLVPMQAQKARHQRVIVPVTALRDYAIRLSSLPGETSVAVTAPPDECAARFLSEVVLDDEERNAKLFAFLKSSAATYNYVSVNDGMGENAEAAGKQLREFMEERWPHPSSFELQ